MSLAVYSETDYPLIRRAYRAVLEFLGQTDNCFIELNFTDKDTIRAINSQTRSVDKVTDVLSFPTLSKFEFPLKPENHQDDIDMETGEIILGEIIICADVAREQAKEYGHSFDREICYLAVHGFLHLFGYDHIKDEDKTIMRRAEETVMSSINLSR